MPFAARADGQGASHGGKDWRAKYDGKTDDGRERTCLTIAGYWHGALKGMAEQTRAAGVNPIIDPDMLLPAIVLTVDEFLPEHVKLSHKHVALGGSMALIVQRWARRKDIAEAMKRGEVDQAVKLDPIPKPPDPVDERMPVTAEPPPTAVDGVDAVVAMATAAATALGSVVEHQPLY